MEKMSITYKGNEIIKYNDSEVILKTGGCKSTKVKNKINKALKEHGINMKVFEQSRNFYVSYKGDTYAFHSSHTLTIKR